MGVRFDRPDPTKPETTANCTSASGTYDPGTTTFDPKNPHLCYLEDLVTGEEVKCKFSPDPVKGTWTAQFNPSTRGVYRVKVEATENGNPCGAWSDHFGKEK